MTSPKLEYARETFPPPSALCRVACHPQSALVLVTPSSTVQPLCFVSHDKQRLGESEFSQK